MDISRMKNLAGIARPEGDPKLLEQLNEVVQLPDDLTLEDVMQRLDACKRALAIVNKMTDPADRKKWMTATFVNLNKVRGAMQRIMKKEGMADQASDDVAPTRPMPAGGMTAPM